MLRNIGFVMCDVAPPWDLGVANLNSGDRSWGERFVCNAKCVALPYVLKDHECSISFHAFLTAYGLAGFIGSGKLSAGSLGVLRPSRACSVSGE